MLLRSIKEDDRLLYSEMFYLYILTTSHGQFTTRKSSLAIFEKNKIRFYGHLQYFECL